MLVSYDFVLYIHTATKPAEQLKSYLTCSLSGNTNVVPQERGDLMPAQIHAFLSAPSLYPVKIKNETMIYISLQTCKHNKSQTSYSKNILMVVNSVI